MAYLENNSTNNSLILMTESSAPVPLISDSVRFWLESLLNFLMFAFSMLGVVTNIINIRVFIHQGVSSDSNTIGLFALAVADFLGCIFLVPTVACEVFRFKSDRYHARSCTSLFVYFCYTPHSMMSRVTSCVTVYIAIERSLCVLLPFKVKTILRPKVTSTAMFLIYLLIIGSYLPLFPNLELDWLYYGDSNSTRRSRVRIVELKNQFGRDVLKYQSLTLSAIMPALTIVIMTVTNFLMLRELKKYSKWRGSASNSNGLTSKTDDSENKQRDTVQAKRDVEVLRTVVMVTGLFFVCLVMSFFPGLTGFILPGFNFRGVNANAFYVFYFYKFIFDLINSSLNFFFYIRVSSRYITSFDEVFRKKKS